MIFQSPAASANRDRGHWILLNLRSECKINTNCSEL